MQPSDHGAAKLPDLVTPQTIASVFLKASSNSGETAAPLTPFMIHVWRQRGLDSEEILGRAPDRERFVNTFYYSTFHQTRAPYRLAVAPEMLQWLNLPALDASSGLDSHRAAWGGWNCYLTRYMLHVWKNYQRDMDVLQPAGYLRFLTWFALEYIPAWNLPPSLLPDDLLPVLNHPVRTPLPLTAAMRVIGELRGLAGMSDLDTAPDEAVVATSFELLSYLLEVGDPRLIPDLVSKFWSKPLSPDPESLNAFEYFAVRACHPDIAAHIELASARQWCATQYRAVVPGADAFCSPPVSAPNGSRSAELNSPEKLVVVYRDHHTIAGLSKAGLLTKEALEGAGLDIVDLDFDLGRSRMIEESAHNYRVRRRARKTLHILNLNPEYIPECLLCHLSSLDESSYLIGQFYWELSDIAAIHECGLSLVHEIWVATEYLRDVYRKRVTVPVHVMGQGIETPKPDPRFTRATFHLPKDAYVFLFSFDAGSVVERKNPLACAQAFRKAFPAGTEKALLVLKTRSLAAMQTSRDRDHWREVTEIAAGDNRIHLIDHTMTSAELTGLLAHCDCYISLHRSEGFGFGPADAMSLGKPVITTAYSGVTDFCNSETALPIDYELKRVPHGAYPYMDADRQYYWASPDIEAAAFQMRRLYENPGIGQAIGECGRQWIRRHYSVEALQRRYTARLAELGWL
jgi:glycosyltransferase involved in cell wall biosynthesis